MTAAAPSRYRVVQARPHPLLDIHKKLSHLLLRSERLNRLARFKRRYGSLAVFLYVSSIPGAIAALFSAASSAQVLSIVVSTMQLPLVTLAVLWLRPAMLRVLLSTYDFWFFSIMNLSTLLLLALSFRDARTLLAVFMWLNMQYHICIDAAMDNSRATRLVIVVSCVFHHELCVAVAVEAIPDVHNFNVLQTKGRTLGSKDLLVSSLGALLFLMVRIISRKGVFAVQDETQCLWCVSYRCTVKIVPVSDIAASSASLHVKRLSSPRVKARRMTYVPRDTVYDGHEMLSGCWISLEVWPTWQQRLLQASGFAGLSLNGVLFLWLNYMAKEQLSAREHVFSVVVATLMILFTCCFCFTCFAHYHPELLRLLLRLRIPVISDGGAALECV